MIGPMDLVRLIWCAFIELFRSRASLQAEILTLRHQLNVLRRKSPQRLTFGGIDRLVFAGLYRDVRRGCDAQGAESPPLNRHRVAGGDGGSPAASAALTLGRTSAALTRRRDLDLAVAGHSSFYPDVQ